MSHAARANEVLRELDKFSMNSGAREQIIVDILSEGDELKKTAKASRARITLLEKAAEERNEKVATLENQKQELEGRLERLTKAKIARNNRDRLARSQANG